LAGAAQALARRRRPSSILQNVSDALFFSREKVMFFFLSKYSYFSLVGFVNLADSQMLSRMFHILLQLIQKMSDYVICKKKNY